MKFYNQIKDIYSNKEDYKFSSITKDDLIFDELHKRNGKSANWDTLWEDILSWRLRQDELYSFTMSDEGE